MYGELHRKGEAYLKTIQREALVGTENLRGLEQKTPNTIQIVKRNIDELTDILNGKTVIQQGETELINGKEVYKKREIDTLDGEEVTRRPSEIIPPRNITAKDVKQFYENLSNELSKQPGSDYMAKAINSVKDNEARIQQMVTSLNEPTSDIEKKKEILLNDVVNELSSAADTKQSIESIEQKMPRAVEIAKNNITELTEILKDKETIKPEEKVIIPEKPFTEEALKQFYENLSNELAKEPRSDAMVKGINKDKDSEAKIQQMVTSLNESPGNPEHREELLLNSVKYTLSSVVKQDIQNVEHIMPNAVQIAKNNINRLTDKPKATEIIKPLETTVTQPKPITKDDVQQFYKKLSDELKLNNEPGSEDMAKAIDKTPNYIYMTQAALLKTSDGKKSVPENIMSTLASAAKQDMQSMEQKMPKAVEIIKRNIDELTDKPKAIEIIKPVETTVTPPRRITKEDVEQFYKTLSDKLKLNNEPGSEDMAKAIDNIQPHKYVTQATILNTSYGKKSVPDEIMSTLSGAVKQDVKTMDQTMPNATQIVKNSINSLIDTTKATEIIKPVETKVTAAKTITKEELKQFYENLLNALAKEPGSDAMVKAINSVKENEPRIQQVATSLSSVSTEVKEKILLDSVMRTLSSASSVEQNIGVLEEKMPKTMQIVKKNIGMLEDTVKSREITKPEEIVITPSRPITSDDVKQFHTKLSDELKLNKEPGSRTLANGVISINNDEQKIQQITTSLNDPNMDIKKKEEILLNNVSDTFSSALKQDIHQQVKKTTTHILNTQDITDTVTRKIDDQAQKFDAIKTTRVVTRTVDKKRVTLAGRPINENDVKKVYKEMIAASDEKHRTEFGGKILNNKETYDSMVNDTKNLLNLPDIENVSTQDKLYYMASNLYSAVGDKTLAEVFEKKISQTARNTFEDLDHTKVTYKSPNIPKSHLTEQGDKSYDKDRTNGRSSSGSSFIG